MRELFFQRVDDNVVAHPHHTHSTNPLPHSHPYPHMWVLLLLLLPKLMIGVVEEEEICALPLVECKEHHCLRVHVRPIHLQYHNRVHYKGSITSHSVK